jgi:Reverse transcriptase (RNA-dependent DNA polymerase)
MDRVFLGFERVHCYIDDILIGDATIEALKCKLIRVLEQLKKYNFKVNFEKCKFFVQKVTYLGHEVSLAGISPSKKKIEAIISAPAPKNIS